MVSTAAHRTTCRTLTDTSKSITLYLNDEQSVYRVLAIDLCSRGFQVWGNYVDAMEILRTIFTLATNTSKQAITAQNVGAQARLAVLQIASSNTPLFMTTMGLDILHPRSVEYRKSVLQIFAFLIRKVSLSWFHYNSGSKTIAASPCALSESTTLDGGRSEIPGPQLYC